MSTADDSGTDRQIDANPTVIVAVLAFSGVVAALMHTVIIPVIPQLPGLLNASAADTAWAITATLLAAAVSVPMMGRLGDMFGKRRMLLVCFALLVAGSFVCAVATDVLTLIVGRSLQGLSAGVIPLGISIMRDVLPSKKLPGAVATMSSSLGVGGALGLPIAALIAEYSSWHVLFWTSGALGIVAAGLVILVVPESNIRTGGTFDFGGALSLSVTLITLLLVISKGGSWGWTSQTTMVLAIVFVLAFVLWVWWELRVPGPLVDLRVSVRPQVLFTNMASIVVGFAMFAMSLVFPQVLQLPAATGYGLEKSMLVAGLAMAPSGIMMMMISPVSAWITTTRGPKTTLMCGAVGMAVGYGGGVLFMHSLWQLVLISMIIGVGVGLAYGAMPALIMGAVPTSETGAANSFNTLMRSLGTSSASAIAGVILAQMTMSLGSVTVPTENAFRIVMASGAGAALVAFGIAWFIPKFGAASADLEVNGTDPHKSDLDEDSMSSAG
ncbi:MFS transporter [Nocardia sp. 348MFTsu5.1]|uniref:MFS transporter n=1 Tax=Nocardia sp. 348MFTsu5.1 TaxID=1172185 RepID=UPI00036C1AC3|nr:MFS transporter [Nocardia sp. 348MFTsu5.1]